MLRGLLKSGNIKLNIRILPHWVIEIQRWARYGLGLRGTLTWQQNVLVVSSKTDDLFSIGEKRSITTLSSMKSRAIRKAKLSSLGKVVPMVLSTKDIHLEKSFAFPMNE